MKDSKGNVTEQGKDWMRSVEVNGTNHYIREMIPYCDEAMAEVMRKTDIVDSGKGTFFQPK
jgi:hypothetical protein